MSKEIACGIASLPERENNLQETIESIYNQFDIIHVVLNGYDYFPSFLDRDKISVYTSDNERGAAMKYWGVQWSDGYYFSCDDDLIYPPDYVEHMIQSLREYNNKIVVSAHGGDLKQIPLRSARKILYPVHHFQREMSYDKFVMMGGTGVMAFYQPWFNLSMEEFLSHNMVDADMFYKTQTQEVPVLIASHPQNWIKYQEDVAEKFNIYRYKRAHKEKGYSFRDKVNQIENPQIYVP